jgi:hypothetical protein
VAEDRAKKDARRATGRRLPAQNDRQDLNAEAIWRINSLLTRVEAAFRTLKSALMKRLIFHQLEHRTNPHFSMCKTRAPRPWQPAGK